MRPVVAPHGQRGALGLQVDAWCPKRLVQPCGRRGATCRTAHVIGETPSSTRPDELAYIARFDLDGDGKLSLLEAHQALTSLQAQRPTLTAGVPLAFRAAVTVPVLPVATSAPALIANASTTPRAAASGPVTWDVYVWRGVQAARARGEGVAAAFWAYAATKLTNNGKNKIQMSDLVWSFVGMFTAVALLGVMNLHVRSWPVVGEWHQQGLGLLLGSFGTLCVLLFGAPAAEAVRMWNFLAGHVLATATVLGLLHVLGPGVLSRALAMALMIAAMLFTDSVHPPGGALVLMAVDSAAIQRMDWWFMLYPSLAVTAVVLLPLGAAINWLKRNVRFDWPAAKQVSLFQAVPSAADPVLRPKVA